MAQGSRFSAPKFGGGGLWDPRQSGVAWPEPMEGEPYVKGANGMSGCSGCGGGMGQYYDVSKLLKPNIIDLKRSNLVDTIKSANLRSAVPNRLRDDIQLLTPNVMFAAQALNKQEAEDKKKKKMLIIGGAVVLGVGLIFLANR